MDNDYTLPVPPKGDYYWEFRDVGGDGIAWHDNLVLYRHRKHWFDKRCGVVTTNSWLMDQPLTPDEALEKASYLVAQEMNGPLTPITGYRHKGTEY